VKTPPDFEAAQDHNVTLEWLKENLISDLCSDTDE